MQFVVEMDHNESGATFIPEQGRGFVAFGVRRKSCPGSDGQPYTGPRCAYEVHA